MVRPLAIPLQIPNILGHWRGADQVCKCQGASEPQQKYHRDQRHEVTTVAVMKKYYLIHTDDCVVT